MYCSTGAVIILSWWPRRSDCAAGQKAERREERTWRERGGKRITPCVYTFFSLVWGERGVCKRNPLWVMIYRPEFPLNTAEREGKPPLIFPPPPPLWKFPSEDWEKVSPQFGATRQDRNTREEGATRQDRNSRGGEDDWLPCNTIHTVRVMYIICIALCAVTGGGDIASFYGRQSLNNG